MKYVAMAFLLATVPAYACPGSKAKAAEGDSGATMASAQSTTAAPAPVKAKKSKSVRAERVQ